MLELDKGLRSDEIGKQCEAIVRFGELMEQWPLPSVVNTSVLKLADVFRERYESSKIIKKIIVIYTN